MKVMKARNAKACWGFVWIKPVSDWDRAQGYLVFPVGVRKATNRVCKLWRAHGELGHPHQLHVRVQPGVVQELMPLTRLCLGGEELRGRGSQADGSGSQKVTRWLFYDSWEKPSARGFLPQGRLKVVPTFATELDWNKDKAEHLC